MARSQASTSLEVPVEAKGHAPPPRPGPPVHARVRDERLEVRFRWPFTDDDVRAVKSIRGRRWSPERRVWRLPNTPETVAALRRAFGARLVVQEGGALGGDRRPGCDGERLRGGGSSQGPEAVVAAMRRVLRAREYSPRTEGAYEAWVRRLFRFHAHRIRDVRQLEASHVESFLEHLATDGGLAARSRNQAASALAFMFREVLGRDDMAGVSRAKEPRRVPLVLSHREAILVLRQLTGRHFLVGGLLYSGGLRLGEAVSLRVKDVDLELRQLTVRDGKGGKDRYAPLAERLVGPLGAQIRRVEQIQERDRANGHGWAALPGALHRKDPAAGYALAWQFLFPATTPGTDPATGRRGRHHLHESAVQRAVKRAVRRSGVRKNATCHTFRHSFATEALRGGCDIRTLQEVMGHKDIRTTMIYLHAIEQTGVGIRSPFDRPDPEELAGEEEASGWGWGWGRWRWAASGAVRSGPVRSGPV